jgi:Ni,Fe-hydrogenase III large subunit
VLTGPNNRLARWRVRAPTYQNLQVVPVMLKDQEIADVPISIGSLDPCFSCTERMELVDRKSGTVQLVEAQDVVDGAWKDG